MKKANYTFRLFEKSLTSVLVMVLALFSPAIVDACEMSCTQSQQVSLDENCEAEITPTLILSDDGASCPDGTTFTVAAKMTMNGPNILEGETIMIDGSMVNQNVIIEVTSDDNGTINRCWGTILVEDKLAPTVDCQDVTVNCNDAAALTPPIMGTECGDVTVNLVGQTPDVNLCTDDFLRTFDQSFTATDAQGNTSPVPCTRTVTVRRIDVDAIEFPANLRVATDNGLQCDSGYETIEEGSIVPSLAATGVPTLNGDDLIPTENFNCNTVVTFSDLVLPEVGCVTKVMRTFVVSEWICGVDEITDSTQIIEIVDTVGPTIAPLNDVSISTSTGFDCEAAYLLPIINAEDNCKDVSRIDIAYPGGFIEDYDGSEMITLPRGSNLITVTAYDACLNFTEATFTVSVADNNAPVAVCDQNTVVALSSNENGLTEVAAISFDDGSYDECGLASPAMAVKRMDDGAACGLDGSAFSSSVFFCCEDLGTNTQVIFQVTDLDGNSNTCMVNVELQDKLPPSLSAPADMTVDCDFPFELNEQGMIAAFGDATGVDNCGDNVDISRSFNDLRDDMCNTGELRRFFAPATGTGSVVFQRIFFVNDDPFDVDTDIEWPDDVTIDGCLPLAMGMNTEDLPEVAPDVTGVPTLGRDACDMVGVSVNDRLFEIFNSNTASCFKIIRTWTVKDHCADRERSYDQVIMVVNNIAPTLELACDTITAISLDAECQDGAVTLTMAASDDCTPPDALSWQYSIDADNDGSLDFTSEITSGTSVDSLNGGLVSTLDASGDFPIGTHRIIWTVEDRCGNLTRCEQIFNVVNDKAPTPYCYNGLAIEIMGVDTDGDNVVDAGMIDIWASDFDAGSFHSCGYDVTVSFSENPLDTGRTYTCDDLGQQPVEIWATSTLPDGSIVQDFCRSFINIQDNMNRCTEQSEEEGEEEEAALMVTGTISTENHDFVEDVEVQITNLDMVPAMTNADGYYEFADMQKGGAYTMRPKLDLDPINGVTTVDLVLIQRHILGINEFDSPYKVIAADINNDGNVTSKDLLDLRKAILGLTPNFPGNESWKFVDAGYQFVDPSNPLTEQYAQSYEIYDLDADMSIDFMGVKIGDVNSSVTASSKIEAEVRHAETLTFLLDNQKLTKGSQVDIPVYAENFVDMYAYQHTIKLDNSLRYEGIKKGALDLTVANVGTQMASEGYVTTSWDNIDGESVSSTEPLYYISVSVNSTVNVAEAISFDASITKAEAYSSAGMMNVNVAEREAPITAGRFALYQNTPNPFEGSTLVRFELPEAGTATLSVFDLTGKLIKTYANNYVAGMNEIELNVQDLGTSGVLYYTLRTGDHTATKKMVVIR